MRLTGRFCLRCNLEAMSELNTDQPEAPADTTGHTDGETAGDLTVADPWGSPIVVAVVSQSHGSGTQLLYTAYVVSAGPNKTLDMATWGSNTDGSLNSGDDIAQPIKSWKDVP